LSINGYDYEADPFLFLIENEIYIAFEKMNYVTGHGKLEAVNLDGEIFDFFSEINKIKGHKSFPFVFNIDGGVFCIPETSDLNSVNLYKFNPFSCKFEYHSTLLDKVKYVDTILIFNNNIFYLMCSLKKNETYQQEVYHSKKFDGDYEIHKKSPFFISSKFGRNAGGVIRFNGKMFRPAQDCEESYGKRIVFREITKLNLDDIEEKTYNILEPINPFDDGIHNISILDDMIVIDGKIRQFNFNNIFKKTKFKVLNALDIEVDF
jgi:hypothetical protein